MNNNNINLKKQAEAGKKFYDALLEIDELYKGSKEHEKRLKNIHSDLETVNFNIFNYIQQIGGKPLKTKIKRARGSYNKNNKFNTMNDDKINNNNIMNDEKKTSKKTTKKTNKKQLGGNLNDVNINHSNLLNNTNIIFDDEKKTNKKQLGGDLNYNSLNDVNSNHSNNKKDENNIFKKHDPKNNDLNNNMNDTLMGVFDSVMKPQKGGNELKKKFTIQNKSSDNK